MSSKDIEKNFSQAAFVERLRKLADCLEQGTKFEIQIKGERVYVPVDAELSIEYERGEGEVELEFQLKWKR